MAEAGIKKIIYGESGKTRGYIIVDKHGNERYIKSKRERVNKNMGTGGSSGSTANSTKECMNNGEEVEYLLMNKDNVVGEYNSRLEDVNIIGKLPYGYTNLRDWAEDRKRFTCANRAKEFLEEIGIKDMQEFIDLVHCISLSDTFWIKRAHSKVSWDAVSPYRNNYSDLISAYALEGIKIARSDGNYMSPEISTGGTFPHTWKFNNGDIRFIKAGSKYTLGGRNSGREPYSEYYAHKVAEFLNFRSVDYKLRYHERRDGRIEAVTECKCYTSENVGSVTAHRLGLDSYEDVIEYCRKLGDESYKTVLDMLFLDCLLMNTDRHFSNIEFLMNNDTLEIIEIAPIYDNNWSLLPRFIEGLDSLDRDEYRARDGRKFEELYELISGIRTYRKELIKLKKLKLVEPQDVEISSERLKFLNWFLQEQVEYLLKL